MPNPLLPPDISFADVRSICAQLPEELPVGPTYSGLAICYRPEHIFIGARGCGKTALVQQMGLSDTPPFPVAQLSCPHYGVYDDNGQHSDAEVLRIVQAMLRRANSQKHYAPYYKPIVLLRAGTWFRIRNSLQYVQPEYITHISPPPYTYARALLEHNVPIELVAGYLGPRWHQQFKDANGHFLPAVAWRATVELGRNSRCNVISTAKAIALAEAGKAHLRRYYHEYLPHLVFIAPEDAKYRLRGTKVAIMDTRIQQRLRTVATRQPLGMTKPRWMATLEALGIWRKHTRGWYIFARPYGGALSTMKHELTLTTLF